MLFEFAFQENNLELPLGFAKVRVAVGVSAGAIAGCGFAADVFEEARRMVACPCEFLRANR